MSRRLALGLGAMYLAGGIPLGLLGDAQPVHLRHAGVGLGTIGLLGLAQLPWSLKPLWAPLVDRLGSLRRWMVCALVVVAGATAALAGVDSVAGGTALLATLLIMTSAAATFDLATDAAFIRTVPVAQLGPANGLRIAAYRGGLVLGGGVLVAGAGAIGWSQAVLSLAALLALGALVLTRQPAGRPVPAPTLRSWLDGLWLWLRAPGGAGTLAFLLLFRVGDAMLAAVARPFWVDRGLSPAAIGLAASGLGIGLTVLGALLGGAFTARVGIAVGLLVLGALQAASNLGYAAVAAWDLGAAWLLAAIAAESFCQGLGTAAQLALVTRLCDCDHAATQFAVLTALAGLTRAQASAVGGVLAQAIGMPAFFSLSCAAALPALVLLPAVNRRLRACAPDAR